MMKTALTIHNHTNTFIGFGFLDNNYYIIKKTDTYIYMHRLRQLKYISPLISCYSVDKRSKLSTVAHLFDAFNY